MPQERRWHGHYGPVGGLAGGLEVNDQVLDEVDDQMLDEVRRICLALPEASERETWGHPTFRVRDKIFATYGQVDDADGFLSTMTMKAAEGEQESLLAEGHPFFYPNYVGSKGWIGLVLDSETDWTEITELVEDSFRLIAPKRVSARLDEPG